MQVFSPNEKYLNSIHLSDGADAVAIDAQDNLYVVSYPSTVIRLAALKP